ncbi:hypothetical protein L0F51_19015 [Afifella sp. H1R]|uniref:hypothetical protein n=1 Tax=Afifella sp. H1R TaxID=2908841 RepID=UPI001F3AD1F2|nr:hypothetical protein [Afifella sp. H1R]MCF1505852.1 hypothetical protein [Afifella sp. H1R]
MSETGERPPLFANAAQLWRGFLILNLLIVPALAILAGLYGDFAGPGLQLFFAYLVTLVGVIGNFTIWLSARRMKLTQHWLILVWILLCLATAIVMGAASPITMMLHLVLPGPAPATP